MYVCMYVARYIHVYVCRGICVYVCMYVIFFIDQQKESIRSRLERHVVASMQEMEKRLNTRINVPTITIQQEGKIICVYLCKYASLYVCMYDTQCARMDVCM